MEGIRSGFQNGPGSGFQNGPKTFKSIQFIFNCSILTLLPCCTSCIFRSESSSWAPRWLIHWFIYQKVWNFERTVGCNEIINFFSWKLPTQRFILWYQCEKIKKNLIPMWKISQPELALHYTKEILKNTKENLWCQYFEFLGHFTH